VDCATQALEKYNIEKDIAAYIKKEFDKKYNPTWHCIVGRNFGSYVTHETRYNQHLRYPISSQLSINSYLPGTSFISTLAKWPFYFSRAVKACPHEEIDILEDNF
jgi:hypothetical protein